MKNWKTTTAGIIAAILSAYANGAMADTGNWKQFAAAAAIAGLGYLAHDAR